MYDDIFQSLSEILAFLNRPQQDKILLAHAGIAIDTALLGVLVQISMNHKISISELADRLGRDHSTVSRQVAKLEELGFTTSQPSRRDKRQRELTLTRQGKSVAVKIAHARRELMRKTLGNWDERSLHELQKGLEHLVETLPRDS